MRCSYVLVTWAWSFTCEQELKCSMSVAGRCCSFARNLSLKQSFRYKLPTTKLVTAKPRLHIFCLLSGAVKGKVKPVEIAHLWQTCPRLPTLLHKQGEKSESPFQVACRQYLHSWDRGCGRHFNPAGTGVFLPLCHLPIFVTCRGCSWHPDEYFSFRGRF